MLADIWSTGNFSTEMVSFSGGGSFNMLTVIMVTGICTVMTGYRGVK